MSALTHITKCKLCGKQFDIDAVPIIGEQVAEKAKRFQEALLKHAQAKHPERLQQIIIATVQYQIVLILSVFEVGDPAISDAMGKAREFALAQLTSPADAYPQAKPA